ncbi:juvenile hormone esterase [Schistocerca piceifrons]|uniref:juvenile hormone esterase n=1 Tax=Schistocerca piceifrons TaxID=274613 RepID=UPI001F5F4155|nr:juvenile hormone esterase [Schistocerca piceifrons]
MAAPTSRYSTLLLLLLAAAVAAAGGDVTVVATTRYGRVRGRVQATRSGRSLLAFYNLPYAKPPVGPLRFKAPEPPQPWLHIRDATTAGPLCTQKNVFLRKQHPTGSEDCLYLNVFTPALKGSLPVMFWIHGGGWISGGGSLYGPDFLLDHDVILVTINYRLGPLGFLSTQDSASPGNYGLKDQVAALQWVKENIAMFGGNPYNVTVFGESAGGASVHYLMMSPLSQGLFHHAISQSGTALMPWALPTDNAVSKAHRLASLLGCPSSNSSRDLVECLREIDDYEIVSRGKDFVEWDIDPWLPFGPVVEAEGNQAFLTVHPLKYKTAVKMPWLIGVNEHEGLLRTAAIFSNESLRQEIQDSFQKLLPISLLYEKAPNAHLITNEIYRFYMSSGGFSFNALTNVFTDGLFVWNTDEAVRLSKDSAPVYYYFFNYRGVFSFSKVFAHWNATTGVCHADELLYLFPMEKLFPSGKRSEEDMQLIHTLTELWANFASTGNPTPNNKPLHWPRVTSDDDMEYMEISNKLEVKRGLLKERINFWSSLPLRSSLESKYSKEEL